MLKVGKRVVVNVPVERGTEQLIKFNGMESVVTSKTSSKERGFQPQFTVKYCESRYGIPYWFVADWLIEM